MRANRRIDMGSRVREIRKSAGAQIYTSFILGGLRKGTVKYKMRSQFARNDNGDLDKQ